MKKTFTLLLAALLCMAMIMPAFAAKTTYYSDSKIKCGYYVSDDGAVSILVEANKITVFDIYNVEKASFYKTSKDALKTAFVSVSKEKPTVKSGKNDFKKLRITIDSKGNVSALVKTQGYSNDDTFKVYYAGTSFSSALKLAKKKLDTDFS